MPSIDVGRKLSEFYQEGLNIPVKNLINNLNDNSIGPQNIQLTPEQRIANAISSASYTPPQPVKDFGPSIPGSWTREGYDIFGAIGDILNADKLGYNPSEILASGGKWPERNAKAFARLVYNKYKNIIKDPAVDDEFRLALGYTMARNPKKTDLFPIYGTTPTITFSQNRPFGTAAEYAAPMDLMYIYKNPDIDPSVVKFQNYVGSLAHELGHRDQATANYTGYMRDMINERSLPYMMHKQEIGAFANERQHQKNLWNFMHTIGWNLDKIKKGDFSEVKDIIQPGVDLLKRSNIPIDRNQYGRYLATIPGTNQKVDVTHWSTKTASKWLGLVKGMK